MSSSSKRANAITKGARVLVVDDDSDGAEAAGKLLETFGCAVSLVGSAGEALERIEEGAGVDLVFSDVVMPDIDGLEFAERLNTLRPGLPVIFCTGYSSAVEALTGANIRGRRVVARVDRDRPPRERGERGERGGRGDRVGQPRGKFPRRPGTRDRGPSRRRDE